MGELKNMFRGVPLEDCSDDVLAQALDHANRLMLSERCFTYFNYFIAVVKEQERRKSMGNKKKPLTNEELVEDLEEWVVELFQNDGGQFCGGTAMINAYKTTRDEILRRME
jgi:hypothetical protein